MKILVRNLARTTTEEQVTELFEEYGTVQWCKLVMDKATGKSKGFGFVEMAQADADNAIAKLNDSEFQQRTLKVREAKQKQEDDSSSLRTETDQSV